MCYSVPTAQAVGQTPGLTEPLPAREPGLRDSISLQSSSWLRLFTGCGCPCTQRGPCSTHTQCHASSQLHVVGATIKGSPSPQERPKQAGTRANGRKQILNRAELREHSTAPGTRSFWPLAPGSVRPGAAAMDSMFAFNHMVKAVSMGTVFFWGTGSVLGVNAHTEQILPSAILRRSLRKGGPLAKMPWICSVTSSTSTVRKGSPSTNCPCLQQLTHRGLKLAPAGQPRAALHGWCMPMPCRRQHMSCMLHTAGERRVTQINPADGTARGSMHRGDFFNQQGGPMWPVKP